MTTDIKTNNTAVMVEDITKVYGDFTAVDNISFEVERGEIFGFLGPNGAGKSTTIKMLCGIVKPSSGDGYVGGYSIKDNSDEIKMISGYMSQKFSLYGDLTPGENLEFYCGAYGLNPHQRKDRIAWALKMSDLEGRKDNVTADLPGGFKQRLALGAAILHKPSILFLDEPTAGVDPHSRRDFWDLIYNMSAEGVTVFVTTHYMDEAEHCDRIAFIDKGKLIKLNTPSMLKKNYDAGNIYELEAVDWLKTFNTLRSKGDSIGEISLFGSKIHISTETRTQEWLERYLNQEGIEFISFREIYPSLEDVFVSVLQAKPEEEDKS